MPLLRKLADCLGILYSAPGRSPAIANSISPVADPELSFGWQGNLYTDSGVLTAQAANTIIASLTVVEDCFYTLDATVVIAGTVQYAGRVALEILDPAGGVAYRLTYGFVTSVITAVGATNTPPVEIYGLHLHLLASMVVRWRIIDVQPGGGPVNTVASLCLRKLYQDQL